jgi:hypothetical protein
LDECLLPIPDSEGDCGENECIVYDEESKTCRDACERVEYLESMGDPYIDTGIKPTDEYGYHIRNTYRYNGGEQCAIGAMDAGNRFVGVYTGGIQISSGWGSFVGFLKNSYRFDSNYGGEKKYG